MGKRILIVDDEPQIVSLLKDYFLLSDYEPLAAKDAAEALKLLEQCPDLILLDINMPGMDGIELCKKIRPYVSCPILFLTAKVEDADKVNGFLVGGDDYIVKPFSIDELGARVAAHLRREERAQSAGKPRFEEDLVIDYSQKAVYCEGEAVPLAKKEFEIIEFLSLNSGQVFDKERIYERLWGYDSEGNSSVVAEHIRRIRAKLSQAGCKNHIETVWGMGYKWIR